jgi:oxygen-independent coproporphyrinogen-3 oxidase
LPLEAGSEPEFSVEANPNDITPALLASLAAAGVNRLSLGVQSFQDHVLQVLEREHRGEEAMAAIEMAKAVVPRVSLDLIFATPGQTTADWQADLRIAVDAGIEHVSTYGLTYEKGAAFWGRVAKNTLTPTAEETERSMYLLAIQQLEDGGFEHYEVSNFAKPGAACRHNINYWQGGDYLAFGPGAARHHQGRRETNHRSVTTYIKRILAGESVVAESEDLTAEQQARERLVFGLRMREGVARPWLQQTTGYSLDDLAGESLGKHVAHGMLEDDGVRVRFTESGLLVSDLVLVDFL